MSDIFSVSPPSWLTHLAQPANTSVMAKDVGMILGGSLLALQPDPNKEPVTDPDTGETTQPVKGLKQGLYEARMSQADPQWALKEKGLEAAVVNNWARAAESWQQVDLQKRETAAWASHDLPELYKYREELKENPTAPAPVMESIRGNAVVNRIQTGLAQGQIAKTSAIAFQKMIESLAAKGGAASVIAGKYARAIGSVPSPQVLQEFGQDLGKLGLSEQDLIDASPLPVSKITTGPKGTVITRGEEKAQSQLGKLQADRDKAINEGDQSKVDELNAKIQAEGGSKPEFFTDPASKRRFMRWGTKHYDLSALDSSTRIRAQVATDTLKRAEKALDALPVPTANDKDEVRQKYQDAFRNVMGARDRLDSLVSPVEQTQTAPAATATTAPAQIFTDKSGKKFKYKGTMSDPSQDKNPNSWEMVE